MWTAEDLLEEAPPTGLATPDAASIPPDGLAWPGASAEELDFMRRVYAMHVAQAGRRRRFLADVPAAELETVEGRHQLRTAAAQDCRAMLARARAAVARARAAGDAAARAVSAIGVASAYRSASRQFALWQGYFPRYYAETEERRAAASGGALGEAAAALLLAYIAARIAAPGFSLHNEGRAVDLTTTDGGRALGARGRDIPDWRRSWLWGWLAAEAAGFNFHQNTAIDEPWHWEHRAPRPAAAEAWPVATPRDPLAEAVSTPAGQLVLGPTPLLARHRGTQPDLVLRWNDLQDTPEAIDVVVHLHGYSSAGEAMRLLRDKLPVSGLDFADPDDPADPTPGRARPTLAILPRGNFFGGKRGESYDFPALAGREGLPRLVDHALAEFSARTGLARPARGRLILTAHSGGGAALLAALANSPLVPDEVQVFDGLYTTDPASLAAWARRAIARDAAALAAAGGTDPARLLRERGGALCVLYIPRNARGGDSGTKAGSEAVARAVATALAAVGGGQIGALLGDRYRVLRTGVAHGAIPRRFGWRLLGDAAALLPGATRFAPGEAAEEAPDTPPAGDRSSRAYLRWVQAALNRLAGAGLAEDGVAGARTRAAIRAFQARQGLAADGVVGARTEAAILAALDALRRGGGAMQAPAAPSVPCPPPQPMPARCQGIAARETIDCFDFNGASVLPRHLPRIENIALCLLESRRTATPIDRLTIVGHTDPVGGDAANNALGLRRARAVKAELLAALARLNGGRAPAVAITTETRGERAPLPGDPALSRRVEVVPPFAFAPPAPATAAAIEIVTDDDDDQVVDAAAPVAAFVRFGLWNRAYDAAGDVRNGEAERNNFVGSDRRRVYLRVRDPASTTRRVTASWKTLLADRATDDDAPASQEITLSETRAGSRTYVSRAIILVTDDADAGQPTHSGLAPPLSDAGLRRRGQSNHRLRRARLDGFVQAEYRPAAGTAARVLLPVFRRNPADERRRLRVRVVNYGPHATPAYIAGQFAHANARWAQVGLVIEARATVDRPIPPAALDGSGLYAGSADNAFEQAALADLIPTAPDNTLTAVFVPMTGANAYATIAERTRSALGERYFIFINTTLDLNDETLAHELAHVLFNRFDAATERRFYTLNTNAPTSFGVALPDVRIYRRIQDRHSPSPDNDPNNDNIVNWARRRRTARFPISGGLDAPTATTGNTLVEVF